MMEYSSVGRGLTMNDGDSVSIAAQLEKLQALRASGTLSEAEFQNLKSALVAKGTAAPKASGAATWLIGALAAVAVVIVIFLLAMPRHQADKVALPVAQSAAPPAAPSPPKAEGSNAPLDQAANGPMNPPGAAEPPPTFPTSFDCTQARRLALRLICTNPNLAAQDVQLAALYRRARENAIDASQLFDQQQEWLAARDSCNNLGCLSVVYAQRRAELARWITR
jgi:hypothetical protein